MLFTSPDLENRNKMVKKTIFRAYQNIYAAGRFFEHLPHSISYRLSPLTLGWPCEGAGVNCAVGVDRPASRRSWGLARLPRLATGELGFESRIVLLKRVRALLLACLSCI